MRFLLIELLHLCFLCTGVALAQERDSLREPSIAGIAVASVIPASVAGVAIYENLADYWRVTHTTPFHWSHDPPYALFDDKFGHAWFASAAMDLTREAFVLANVDSVTALWLSAGLTMFDQTLVEVIDGFHVGTSIYGFSPGDFGADLFGTSFQIGRYYSPFVRRWDFKVSVWPSNVVVKDENIFQNDESHFFWFSCSVPEVLPLWLNLAVGYGVENISEHAYALPAGAKASSLGYVAFDFNPKGLPFHGSVWNVIAEVISHYRFPFPALEVTPRLKWYWLR